MPGAPRHPRCRGCRRQARAAFLLAAFLLTTIGVGAAAAQVPAECEAEALVNGSPPGRRLGSRDSPLTVRRDDTVQVAIERAVETVRVEVRIGPLEIPLDSFDLQVQDGTSRSPVLRVGDYLPGAGLYHVVVAAEQAAAGPPCTFEVWIRVIDGPPVGALPWIPFVLGLGLQLLGFARARRLCGNKWWAAAGIATGVGGGLVLEQHSLLELGAAEAALLTAAAVAAGVLGATFACRLPRPLHPGGSVVRVGPYELRSPGLRGSVRLRDPAPPGAVIPGGPTRAFWSALQSEAITLGPRLEIRRVRLTRRGRRRLLLTETFDPAVEIAMPAPAADTHNALLAVDPSGTTTWSFPEGAGQARVLARVCPVEGIDPAGVEHALLVRSRSHWLHIVTVSLVDPVLGRIGPGLARVWEGRRRPHRLRLVDAASYRTGGGPELDGRAWHHLTGGRALLLLHGTFSRSHAAFGDLPDSCFAELCSRYGGRVFALEHPTVTASPVENVAWFLDRIPDGMTLDLDIACHSRGGLVARLLAERLDTYPNGPGRVTVHDVVFVATPNAGTVLAEPARIGSLLDTSTTLCNLFSPVSDLAVTTVAEGLLGLVRFLAVRLVAELDGIAAMAPSGPFLAWLNAATARTATYHALASDFEPAHGRLGISAVNRIVDFLFQAGNDLIVPTVGVYRSGGEPASFLIDNRYEFDPGESVAHSGFFGRTAAQAAILDWLQAGAPIHTESGAV